MNDIQTLHDAWPQPLPPSHAAHSAARAALLARATASRGGSAGPAPRRRRGFRLPRMGVRLVAVGALAVTIAAGVTVFQNLGGVDENGRPRRVVPGLPAGPVANAQEALNRAAHAAETREFIPPRNDQWIFIEIKSRYPKGAHKDHLETPDMPLKTGIEAVWLRADGRQSARLERGKLELESFNPVGSPPHDYPRLAALPRDPDALLAWAYKEMGGRANTPEERYDGAYGMFGAILRDGVLPPAQEAAIYRALAKIPRVKLKQDAVDVAGRPALALGRIAEGWLSEEILLDRKTYTYMGERSIAIKDHTSTGLDGTWTVKKGTIQVLTVRTAAGIVDKPGQRPKT